VCGVVGTSFLVVVGRREDSWVGSILRHIGWTETRYTKTHGGLGVQDEATRVVEDSIPTDDKPTIYDL
jgi:hypothetical protein